MSTFATTPPLRPLLSCPAYPYIIIAPNPVGCHVADKPSDWLFTRFRQQKKIWLRLSKPACSMSIVDDEVSICPLWMSFPCVSSFLSLFSSEETSHLMMDLHGNLMTVACTHSTEAHHNVPHSRESRGLCRSADWSKLQGMYKLLVRTSIKGSMQAESVWCDWPNAPFLCS